MNQRHLRERLQRMQREDLVIGISFFALTMVMLIVAMLDLNPELLNAATGD